MMRRRGAVINFAYIKKVPFEPLVVIQQVQSCSIV